MDDWDPVPISRLSHAAYCLRRAALLTNEQLWSENADTAKGRGEHDRVHTSRIERRGESVLLFDTDIRSVRLNLIGKCDCIEATADPHGCRLPGIGFPVRLYPVEYKHGKLRTEEEYEIQLCAQAMCLEEMFSASIPEGAVFYISSHRRQAVALTPQLRERVRETAADLERIRRSFIMPRPEYGPKCKRCSLQESCQPQMEASAEAYCRRLASEAKRVIRE